MLAAGIKHGTLVAVITLIACILGIVAALNIPVQMIPDLEVRTITVRTGWPGATPQDVEKEILIEQERYLRALPNLQRMVSYSEMGSASIELEFPFGVDVNEALIRVSNALSQVPNYPENVDQPRLFASSFSSNAFMFFNLQPLPGNPLNLDMDMVRDFAEDYIRPQMETVQGVSQVSVRGGAKRQIQIKIDPAKLAQRGISLIEVRNAIRTRNRDASAGDINDGKQRYLLRMIGRFEDLTQLSNLVISQQGDHRVLLSDIAQVNLDHFEVRNVGYTNGQRAIRLSVRKEAGSNVMAIKKAMLTTVETINTDLLIHNGLQMSLLSDDVKYVKSSVENVWTNLAIGALLATMVMYLFIRSGRATGIGVIGIPICTIAAFIGLLLFDRTINVISLAGVAFAIGMTVDNTIVVLESIQQARARGLARLDAAINGVKEVWPAVLASTATTVLVFAPILFIVQEAGQLYSDIAIAICAAIIASMLVAIFVIPSAVANFGSQQSRLKADNYQRFAPLLKLVYWCVSSQQRARIVAPVIAVVVLFSAYSLMPDAEYLPEGEEPKAFSMMIAPPGYNLTEMKKIGEALRAEFDAHVQADPQAFASGQTNMPPLAYYAMSISVGRIWFLSQPVDSAYIDQMMTAITDKFKSYEGMRAFSARGSIISSNDGGTRAVALDLSGPDLGKLYQSANAVYGAAERYFDNPQINSDPRSLSLNQPLIEIRPRWQRLAELGLNANELGYAISALSDGAFVDEFILDDDKIDIFLLSEAGNEQNINALKQSPIVLPTGQVLPVSALADLNQVANSNSLRRVDGSRTVTVYIIPPRDVALEQAEQVVREQMLPELKTSGALDPNVTVSISGAADQLEATQQALSGNFIIAVALCYLLLVAIFTHWSYPLFILATVPLGMAGGLLGLIAINGLGSVTGGFHQPFDMITMLGFLILLGTVVNNPILIVDQTRKNLLAGCDDVKAAVLDAVHKRITPILMSTATTIFGLAPLVLIPGDGTELYRGVGIIVLSGILIATLISLTFLPALLVSVLKPTPKPMAQINETS